jgi:hypothetical protein
LLLAIAQGCAGLKDKDLEDAEGAHLTQQELKLLFASAIDPRRLSITTYESAEGPVFEGANRLHRGQRQPIPFLAAEPEHMPLVHIAGADRKTFPALLDTSSGKSWLDLETAAGLGLQTLNPGDQAPPTHVLDTRQGYAGAVPKLRFDHIHVETALFYMRGAKGSLGALARGLAKPVPNAVIGSEMMAHFQFFQIDWPARRAFLSVTTPYSAHADQLLAKVPARYVHGALAAEGAVNGQEQVIILDSAGDFAVALPDPPGDRVRQISIGDLVFRNVPVVSCFNQDLGVADYARIGTHLLARLRMTLGDEGRIIYFERPPTPELEP